MRVGAGKEFFLGTPWGPPMAVFSGTQNDVPKVESVSRDAAALGSPHMVFYIFPDGCAAV